MKEPLPIIIIIVQVALGILQFVGVIDFGWWVITPIVIILIAGFGVSKYGY